MKDFTEQQKQELYSLKKHFPYRIIYGVIDKDTGEFGAYASTSMRLPNKLARQGHSVVVLKSSGMKSNPKYRENRATPRTWRVWTESGKKDTILCQGSRAKCLTFYKRHGGEKAGLHFGYWMDNPSSLNIGGIPDASYMADSIENYIREIFPHSFVYVKFSNNLYPSITLRFAKGKDKSEWSNGIIHNDPLFMVGMIDGFDRDGKLLPKQKVEVTVNNNHRNMPFRAKTATAEKLVEYIVNYFKKLKSAGY